MPTHRPVELTRPAASTGPTWLARRRVEATTYWLHIGALEFLLGASLMFVNYPLVGGQPFGMATAAMVIGLACFRHPLAQIRWGGIMLLTAMTLYVFLVVVSVQEGTDWTQRICKFLLLFFMAAALAQRRVDPRSFVIGACTGFALNALAFYAKLTPDQYPPYLTGFVDDKNVAGLYYCVLAMLGVAVMSRGWATAWVLLSSVLVLLTGSRTSISGLALALAWLALRNKVNVPIRLVLTGAGVALLIYVEEFFSEAGIFADRTETDWFRSQIDAATTAKLNLTPWHGLGLNEGFVILGGVRRVWFHDSYAQAFVEGGYPFLWLTLVAFVVVGLGVFSRRRRVSRERLCAEAAIVAVLVCAWKLGEVFMTPAAFIALGLAVGARFGSPVRASTRARWD